MQRKVHAMRMTLQQRSAELAAVERERVQLDRQIQGALLSVVCSRVLRTVGGMFRGVSSGLGSVRGRSDGRLRMIRAFEREAKAASAAVRSCRFAPGIPRTLPSFPQPV